MTTEDRPPLPDADTLEAIFHAALAAGDAKGVEAALTVMAAVDPRRAVALYDDTRAALTVARWMKREG